MVINIAPEKVREVIGPGGKVINKIIDETGVKIDTEDDGKITVAGENTESAQRAIDMIKEIVREPEVGEKYLGRVTKIMNFGAFVEIIPGKDGLLHISEIQHARLEKVEDALKEGEMIDVKLIAVDPKTGKLKLSRKVLLEKPVKQEA